jgi:hypothetical protein
MINQNSGNYMKISMQKIFQRPISKKIITQIFLHDSTTDMISSNAIIVNKHYKKFNSLCPRFFVCLKFGIKTQAHGLFRNKYETHR